MPQAFTEDQLVEQPAIGLFESMSWQTVSAMEETFGEGGTLGRETKGEVVLVSRLHVALERLNPALPPEGITPLWMNWSATVRSWCGGGQSGQMTHSLL